MPLAGLDRNNANRVSRFFYESLRALIEESRRRREPYAALEREINYLKEKLAAAESPPGAMATFQLLLTFYTRLIKLVPRNTTDYELPLKLCFTPMAEIEKEIEAERAPSSHNAPDTDSPLRVSAG